MSTPDRVQCIRMAPFFALHATGLLVLVVGWSWVAVAIAVIVYGVRVFGLTAFYHRYFSHRSFKTHRIVQFLGAFLGNSAGQGGPIWWAAHHRHHHRASDKSDDVHSPRQHGFIWSHMLWFMTAEGFRTNNQAVRDWLKYPELRFLDRFAFLAPALLAAAMFGLGEAIYWWRPDWGVTGFQMLIWGFVISTLAVYHVTFAINSLAHKFGTQPYETNDDSRNNFWLAIITFGEGWHNNHHFYPASVRQGFRWWQIDISYMLLLVMSWFGLVWDLKPVPARVLASNSRVQSDGAL